VVEYGPDTSYGFTKTIDYNLANHYVMLDDLSPDTAYHFRVSSTDAAGNGPDAGTADNNPSTDALFVTDFAVLITFDKPNMQNAAVESNYQFDPALNFDSPGIYGEFYDITNFTGASYYLSFMSIPVQEILSLTVSNITDPAGNPVTPATIKINDNNGDGIADDWEPYASVAEDAEDGNTNGWRIMDATPVGATVNNVYDADRGSRVIELVGDGTYNGYQFNKEDGSPWQNSRQFVFAASLKFSEYFIIYIDMETTAGHRYLRYEPVNWTGLGSAEVVHHGLGSHIIDGQWHTIARDLEADLQAAQPGVSILEVNGLIIRGSGRVDDIKLMDDVLDSDGDGIYNFEEINTYGTEPDQTDTDGDGINDGDEVYIYGTDPTLADTDQDGLNDVEEVAIWGNNWNADYDNDGLINLIDPDSDEDGFLDGQEISAGTLPSDPLSIPARVYEDAEDGATSGWYIIDDTPAGSIVSNVYDADRGNRVIELVGDGTYNGYQFNKEDGSPWQNSRQFVFAASLKFSEYFIIYIDMETTAGYRYLRYEPVNWTGLGSAEVVHHGLGSYIIDGQWHTIARDLAADLQAAQPGVSILEVNGLIIRGSGRVDDIKLMDDVLDSDGDGISDFKEINTYGTEPDQTDTDGDGIDDGDEISTYETDPAIADTDGDGLNDGEELGYWGSDWNSDIDSDGLFALVDRDADNDGVSDGTEVELGFDPADNNDTPASVYEDAEDGNTDGWLIIDATPAGATVGNVYDADLGSRVIELAGNGTYNAYQLDGEDGSPWYNSSQFVFEVSLKFSEYFIIYIEMETTTGRRYLRYEPVNWTGLGSAEVVHHGLGSYLIDGQWHTIARDLAADLQEAQPEVTILEVNGILIRGSGRLDDITLKSTQ
jgi:hypothetical protein